MSIAEKEALLKQYKVRRIVLSNAQMGKKRAGFLIYTEMVDKFLDALRSNGFEATVVDRERSGLDIGFCCIEVTWDDPALIEQIAMTTVEKALVKFPFNKGAMLGTSKSAYAYSHPNDNVVFNANICIKSEGKIWWGDLNITKSESHLQTLADNLGEPIYVLREMDARFEFENSPQFHKAVLVVKPIDSGFVNRVCSFFNPKKD